MTTSVLVANRGEIAVRVIRAAAELDLRTVAVVSQDERDALHGQLASERVELTLSGAAAYLDPEALIRAAVESGAELVHPGYGFLSENADFAQACEAAGLTFVGPSPSALRLLGDKLSARALAQRLGVPVARGLPAGVTVQAAEEFVAALGRPVMIKAAAGGGGRGIRIVERPEEVAAAWDACAHEAEKAFGDGTLYVEEVISEARHIEVQIVADGAGGVIHVGDRDCSVQRRRQKLIEVAPAVGLEPGTRAALHDAALRMSAAAAYESLGTFEFLVGGDGDFVFLEANPRIQVEHTVTEEVFGIDLVASQLSIARGARLTDLGLDQERFVHPRGAAVQVRVNAETLLADASIRPSTGVVSAMVPPGGPGVRVDSAIVAGSRVSPSFDSMLAKVIAHSVSGHANAVARAERAVRELVVDGVTTNAALLAALLTDPRVSTGGLTTDYVDFHAAELSQAPPIESRVKVGGGVVDVAAAAAPTSPPGTVPTSAPSAGTVVAIHVQPGDEVTKGSPVAVLEAMKMEHVVLAPVSGTVHSVAVAVGTQVAHEASVLHLVASEDGDRADAAGAEAVDPDHVRADLREALDRLALADDDARPNRVAQRHATGRRTIRENIEDLIDPTPVVEYGRLAIAAQRARRSIDDLVASTPADGLVAMVARVNGEAFGDEGRCAVLGYDYMVLAGTQGLTNHAKKDRMFDVIERSRLPVVFFAEGGGGRPGDTDHAVVAALNNQTFTAWAGLSGLVPRIAVVNGRCFAGNAAVAGSSDLIVATSSANLGMGGPVMIEGGGLGVFTPEQVGPAEEQYRNGVVDVLVEDDEAAVAVTQRLLGYFQGAETSWEAHDTRPLRHVIPENRLRVYDVREVVRLLCDVDSVTELRRPFGPGMVTCLARIEGRPVGVIANDPVHLSGAITSDGADKATRFLQLCDGFGIPVLSLIDTPGIMVGPDAEQTALVRHANRLFVTAASLTVPFVAIVLRKAYGLGSQAMAAGGMHDPLHTAAWPTGEFGGMGLEGSVTLGYRKEIEAIADPGERAEYVRQRIDEAYELGGALSVATYFEIDSVIDPAESRALVAAVLRSQPSGHHWSTVPRKRTVDTW